MHAVVDGALFPPDVTTNLSKFGRGVVGNLAFVVDETICLCKDMVINGNTFCQSFQIRHFVGCFRFEKFENVRQCRKGRFEGEHAFEADDGAVDGEVLELVAQIVVIAHRKRHSVLHQRLKILNQAKISVNLVDVGAKTHLVDELFTHLADTQFVKMLSYCLEAYLVFKIRRIYHI